MEGSRRGGFTIIELLLVIGIVAIIGASTQPFIVSFIIRNNLEATQDYVISTIRKAQQYAMDGKNDAVWGACRTTAATAIRLYRGGTCDAPTVHESFAIPSNVTVSSFDIQFSKLRGEPITVPVPTVGITTSLDTRSVTVNAAGGMNYP